MHDIWRDGVRQLIVSGVFFLPWRQRKALERWLRGREEYRKLQLADAVVMSWGKSGRTWLRVMLSRYYQLHYGVGQRHLLAFDNLHHVNPAIPRILFSHNNYLRDYTKNGQAKTHFQDKKIILLARDPRDVAVSQFFQWKYRMRRHKMRLNDYPDPDSSLSVFDFVMKPEVGLPRIIDFLNGWVDAEDPLPGLLLVRYEDMRAQPEQHLANVLVHLDAPVIRRQIEEAVAFASYDNLKHMEQRKVFWLSGRRLLPGDRNNPDSYKVRRAKVGGYRDYFSQDQVAIIDALMGKTLSPVYGYGRDATLDTAQGAAS